MFFYPRFRRFPEGEKNKAFVCINGNRSRVVFRVQFADKALAEAMMEFFRCSERDSQDCSSGRRFLLPEFFRRGCCELLFFINRRVLSGMLNYSPNLGDFMKIS